MKSGIGLSLDEARRIALRAQGFRQPVPARPGLAHVRRLADRLNAFQIDSVNVLVRAHYMPAYSRLGPYPMPALDRLAHERRELFEYIGHAFCFIPVALHPFFRWRMERNASLLGTLDPAIRKYIARTYSAVADNGPLSASELPGAGKSKGPWWGWSDGKRAVEALLRAGRVAVAGRRNFERLYDISERVIPKAVLDVPTPSSDQAKKQLLLRAAAALGVGTAKDLAAYFYIDSWWDRAPLNGQRTRSDVPRLLNELVDAGDLVTVSVEGWKPAAFMLPSTRRAEEVRARALVSPFDPLLWERSRAKALFDFDYKIEIYVPAPKRKYGYYVLPFLLGDRFVARVDLKADRKNRVLRVPSVFIEPKADPKYVASELAAELRRMAHWLALSRIDVGERGDLASELRRAVHGRLT